MQSLYTASITVALYTCRAIQLATLVARVTYCFLPVVVVAARCAIAYLVLAGIVTYNAGVSCRDLVELHIEPAIANILNEFCYLINPHLAPDAQSIQYFVDLPAKGDEAAIAPAVECNNIKPLPPVPDVNILDSLSIRQLKKMASTAKVKNYSALTKVQLIEKLSLLPTA